MVDQHHLAMGLELGAGAIDVVADLGGFTPSQRAPLVLFIRGNEFGLDLTRIVTFEKWTLLPPKYTAGISLLLVFRYLGLLQTMTQHR